MYGIFNSLFVAKRGTVAQQATQLNCVYKAFLSMETGMLMRVELFLWKGVRPDHQLGFTASRASSSSCNTSMTFVSAPALVLSDNRAWSNRIEGTSCLGRHGMIHPENGLDEHGRGNEVSHL